MARLAAHVWNDPDQVFTTAHGTPLEPPSASHDWAEETTATGD
jgi:hypothetical protein